MNRDIDIEVSVYGTSEVTKMLYGFSDRLGDRVTLLALRSGANYMLKKVKQAAPVKTGRLRKAIMLKASKIHTRRRDGIVGVYITIAKGAKRNDKKGAYYGKFVEHGWIPGKAPKTRYGRNKRKIEQSHTKVFGKYFIHNTFETNKEATAQLIFDNIEQAGRQLITQMRL